jgi:hypothetical protein
MKRQSLTHEFVDYIPNELKEGTIYVSIQFATAVHKCSCGCGREVVTPLSPTDWKLIFDGETVSLDPSIGNWSYPCQSHYWIRRNKVIWAPRWSRREVEQGRAQDRLAKERYFQAGGEVSLNDAPEGVEKPEQGRGISGLWAKLKNLWSNS